MTKDLEISPQISPMPKYLVREYQSWKQGPYAERQAWYARLADKGQNPRAMLVSCCDSRVDAVGMFGAEPGDLFVVRNVANLVPPYHPDHQHHGTSAAVEYAVNALQVAHIVVVGHSNCGGVKACHAMCTGQAPELEETTSFIGRWMDILRETTEAVIKEGLEGPELSRRLEQEAVLTSIRNLNTFPFVREAVAKGRLSLHAGWIDIATGTLHTADDKGEFRPIA